LGITKDTERRLRPSQGWLWSLREIPSTQRNLWEGFLRVSEASAKPQSRSESSRVKETWTCSKNPRECSDFLEDDSEDFGEILSDRRNLWEGFPKATEASAKLQSHSESSQGGLEHCIPVMVTKFKLSEATSARALVASHSIRRLVFPFVTFWNSTMDVYMLSCIYYVFLEIVGI
jgi:hypothetical protein